MVRFEVVGQKTNNGEEKPTMAKDISHSF